MGEMPTGKITLGRYMWERIHQIGVDTIFGVPGDFNLQFLDSIFHVDGLKWMGNMNELNASYAADGYARVKGVPGCVVTTHGVGELSALNGIAGAMSEQVKLIHVVGQTPRPIQKNHMMIHHSIGNKPDHQLYNKASEGLRYAAAELWDIETAPAEIDRVIRECFLKSGPVYIFLPLDLSKEHVDAKLLDTPINTKPEVDEAAQEKAVKAVIEALKEAKHPTIIVDAWTQRFGAAEEAQQLVQKLHVPWFCANMGKGVVSEDDEMYVGVWNGEVSSPGVKEAAKAADLVVSDPSYCCELLAHCSDHFGLHSLRHQLSRLLAPSLRRIHHPHQPARRRGQRPNLPQHIHQIPSLRPSHRPPLITPALHPQAPAPRPQNPPRQGRNQAHPILPLARHRILPAAQRPDHRRNRHLQLRPVRHQIPA